MQEKQPARPNYADKTPLWQKDLKTRERERENFSPPSLYASMYVRMCMFKHIYSTSFVTVSWRQLEQFCATTRIKNRPFNVVFSTGPLTPLF